MQWLNLRFIRNVVLGNCNSEIAIVMLVYEPLLDMENEKS